MQAFRPRHEQNRSVPRVWLLTGPRAGDNSQVLALGELLGWPSEIKWIAADAPTPLPKMLGSRLTRLRLAGIDRARSSPLAPPWPELVISAGREVEPAARWIKRRSAGRARLVHMGRPWSPLEAFDLVISTPQYSLPERENVLLNQLPLHRVTPQRLAGARAAWAPRLAHLPRPYTALLVGGHSGSFVLDLDKARRLGRLVDAALRERGGSLLVTSSARTPPASFDACLAEIRAPMHVYRWGDPGEQNPFFGYLALADHLVTTGESVSMLAEASATGKPLAIFDLTERIAPGMPLGRRVATVLGYRALRDLFARCIGPAHLQRDIGTIQRRLVAAGRAVWLDGRAGPIATHVPSWLCAQHDGERAIARVRALLGGALPC